jgi:hypothetical protein
MGQFGNKINEVTRFSERLNKQIAAIATTIRYSIAGSAVFGVARLVGQLKEVQVQMGLISAIGETRGGQLIQGQGLTDLMTQARQGAVASITPINQYNDAIINLLSTVSNLPRDQLTPIVTQISQAAQLAQVSAEDATKAFTTMNVAFGRETNLPNIRKMAQEFFILTREAPGGVAAGQQVITQLGQLAQVTRAAHGTPEDMFALLLTTLRSGIPPAQAGRGLQYLIQTVAFPGQQVASSRNALASVGITPTTDMTLQERLGAIFGRARRLGMSGDLNKLTNLDEDTISELEASGDTTQGLSSLGITGRGAEFLGTIFRRIHALRTALAIEGQIDVGQAQGDLKEMTNVTRGVVSDTNDLKKAWKRFHDQAKLQEAAVALNAMGLQVAQTFAPVLNFVAGKVIGGVDPDSGRGTGLFGVAQRHPTGTRNLVIGGALALGGLSLAKGLGLGGMLSRKFFQARALEQMAGGGGRPDGSASAPFYVVVLNEIFGSQAKVIAPGGGGGGGVPWLGRLTQRFPKLPIVGGATALLAASYAAREEMQHYVAGPIERFLHLPGAFQGDQMKWSPTGRPYMHSVFGHNYALSKKQERQVELRRAQELGYRNATGISGYEMGTFAGRAEVFMTLSIDKDGKITKKRVHFPVDTFWTNGSSPSNKGKARQQTRK